MTAPAKPKYRTINWKYYNTALKARLAAHLAGQRHMLARQRSVALSKISKF
jgi:hypothetical protein